MNNKNPFQEASPQKKRMTLIGIYISIIGCIMVSSGTSTLLPIIAADIGGTEYYPLVSTVSGPFNVIAMILYGYLGARSPASKRMIFSVSMLLGVITMLTRALGSSMILNVVTGALWGFASAGLYVIGFSLIRDMHDMKKAGVYLGAVGTMMSIGMLVGPAITGLLIDAISWRAACHFVWPFLLIACLLVFNGVKVKKEEVAFLASKTGVFDYVGAGSLILFLMPLLLVLSLGFSFVPFGSVASNLLIVLTVLGLIALILDIRKKGTAAIVPATALKDRNILCLSACNLFFNVSSMAVFFFMPTYVLYVMGGTATQASLTTTMMSVVGLFLSPILGRMIAKAGNAKSVIMMGTIVRISVTLAFLFLLSPSTNIFVLYALMLIAGIYNCQQSVVSSAAPQLQVKQELRMFGNSVIQVAQALGAAIGTAIFTMVIGASGVEAGMRVAFMIAIAAAVVGLVFSLFLKKLDETVQPVSSAT